MKNSSRGKSVCIPEEVECGEQIFFLPTIHQTSLLDFASCVYKSLLMLLLS